MKFNEFQRLAEEHGYFHPKNSRLFDFAIACYAAGRADEREECAKKCREIAADLGSEPSYALIADECAAAIRARGTP